MGALLRVPREFLLAALISGFTVWEGWGRSRLLSTTEAFLYVDVLAFLLSPLWPHFPKVELRGTSAKAQASEGPSSLKQALKKPFSKDQLTVCRGAPCLKESPA